jgi:hypothetical protein
MTKFRGDTFILPVVITDSNNIPINLTGVTIKFTLAANPAITEATAGVIITRDDVNGKFTITVPASVMNALAAKKYLMDVEVTYADGRKDTLFLLELTLLGDVTA